MIFRKVKCSVCEKEFCEQCSEHVVKCSECGRTLCLSCLSEDNFKCKCLNDDFLVKKESIINRYSNKSSNKSLNIEEDTPFCLEWKSRSETPLDSNNERILIFSPMYSKGHEMRYRIVDSKFLSLISEATHWCYLI